LRGLVPALVRFSGDDFDSIETRLAHREEIDEALRPWCASQNSFEVADRLREAGVPAYAPMRATDFHSDTQLASRGFFIELEHAGFGRSLFDGAVTIYSEMPARPTRAGPLIGEHTFEVMKGILGYSDDEISEIASTGALT
jgi:benzylsuccinate CoA-transferase BbsF subunit/naphthyl-2-methylsuccinate CoA transferase subunit